MKQTITPSTAPDNWNAESLYMKAQRYVQNMIKTESTSWEYALWSSLCLELLCRSALANVSPALLAECDRSWSSLYHSLGFQPNEAKFAPKSIAMNEVLKRLAAIFADFTQEHESFCTQHIGRRNSELHTGENAFDAVSGASWQPKYFSSSKALLATMELTLEDFFGSETAATAQKLISAASDESAKAVKGDVQAHQKVWEAKDENAQKDLMSSANVWATRQIGHRVECPSCKATAIVQGEPVSTPKQDLEDDEIIETQEYLPNQFECIACGLKVLGLSRLTAIGLSERYKKTETYDAAEYYAVDDDYPHFEEDNNEW